MGKRYNYDDKWIIEHFDPNVKLKFLYEEYVKTHGYVGRKRFMDRVPTLGCKRQIDYTPFEEFIKEYYPDHGPAKTREAIKVKFGVDVKRNNLQTYALKRGIKFTGENGELIREAQDKRFGNNGKKKRISINGKYCMYGRIEYEKAYGPIPEGYQILHLDGDVTNNDINNLICVSMSQRETIRSHKMLYQDKTLMEAVCGWSDLNRISKRR